MTELFEQITALHQQVRAFVEKEYPTFKVTSVNGYPATTYMSSLRGLGEIDPARAEFVLVEVNVRFRVEAIYRPNRTRLNCEVFVLNDGTLYFANPVMVR